jgi:hypothetical protein
MARAIAIIVAGWLSLLSAAPPEQGAARAESRFALAIVSDPRGKALVDIDADDFVVQEGNADREILDVRIADYPVVLVLDNGREGAADFEAIKAAMVRFLERMGPRPMAIVTTAGGPHLIATFEDDRETLRQRIDAVEESSDPGQVMHAAALAGQTIGATGALFSAIVIASASPAEAVGPAAEALIAPIVDSRAVVHIVADDRRVAPTGPFLRALSQQTHGDFTAVYAAPSYTPAIERLVTRMTTELMVEYIVPVGSKASDPKIGVKIPGARVRGLGVAPK